MAHQKKNQNIKILLLNPPFAEPIIRDNYCCFTSKSGYLWAPVDLLYISAILSTPTIELSVCDAVASSLPWSHVYDRFSKSSFDYIITLTGTASFCEDMAGLLKLRKQGSKTRFFVLGNTPAFRPGEFLEMFPFLSGVFHNYFDKSILSYILGKKGSYPTISYKTSSGSLHIGHINFQKQGVEFNLDHPPRYDLFPIHNYQMPTTLRKPMITALTTFGCPFSCQFCIAQALQYQPIGLDTLRMQFQAMTQAGIKEIFFQDSTFNADKNRLLAVLEILTSDYSFSWSANIHSFMVTRELLEKMKKSGCHTLHIGVESGNADTLRLYAPSKRLEKIREVFDLCKEVGIKTLAYLIIGFPNENKDTSRNTIKFAKDLDPDFASFSILTPDYGTTLHEILRKNNIIKDTSLKTFDPSGEATIQLPAFPPNEQKKLLREAYRNFYLRPKQLIKYFRNYQSLYKYLVNGLHLLNKRK